MGQFKIIGTNYPWKEGIQMKGYASAQGNIIAKSKVNIHLKSLKILFFRTSRPFSIKLGAYPCVKKIQNCSN
jgi:hypothetical protein